MAFDRFLVAPIKTGLRDDIKPWLLSDDAFAELNNAYIYEGRVRKRFGSSLMNGSVDADVAQLSSRLRLNLGNTGQQSGDITATVPGAPYTEFGQLFSIGDEIFTVKELGTPGTMLTTGGATVYTFNTTTGALVINAAAFDTACYFYPALPVMGITNYEIDEINFEPTIAFDTKFAYQYSAGAWARIGAAEWTGTNADFFWADNARGSSTATNLLFVTNFVEADQIKYWDGSTWTTINPKYNATQTIETARIIVGFKDRVVFLNTVETVAAANTSFFNRCRFSQNGSPIAADAFREDQVGKGGYIDAATQEQIVSAAFLKDRLLVFFERSTWELVYTGNEILPFRWQQINSELGVESTFSVVNFDKAVLGIGDVGIHACNGVNVQRIDQKINHLVFNIHNDNNSVYKVHGIRDFFVQMVYWAYSDAEHDSEYNTHVLTYNYETGSWGKNDDTITVFGYHQLEADVTWGSTEGIWEETDTTWGSAPLSSRFKHVIAGNQQGFVFIIDPALSRNAPALQITNISIVANVVTLRIIDNTLVHDEFIMIENVQGTTGLNDVIFEIQSMTDDTITVLSDVATGTYTGGGTVARVSRIDIKTKQYNFYTKEGSNMFISKVDFLVDKTAHGEITIDSFPSFSDVSLLNDGNATDAILGTSILETSAYATVPLESHSTQLWHSVYLQAEGESVQLRLYLSDEQMLDTDIAFEAFELNAMLFYVAKTGNRLQ